MLKYVYVSMMILLKKKPKLWCLCKADIKALVSQCEVKTKSNQSYLSQMVLTALWLYNINTVVSDQRLTFSINFTCCINKMGLCIFFLLKQHI